MSTYLELCQAVARDSGTIPSLTDPSTVTSQTGRLLRVVTWVNDAWREIQTQRDDWRWMFGMFTAASKALSGTQSYTPTALGITTRFAGWTGLYEVGKSQWSIFLTSDGQSTERTMTYVPWDVFYQQYLVGSFDNGFPQYFTVAPDEKIYLHPTPDATYTLRGFYQKSPQALTVDGDVPEMPARFHDAIKWKALVLMAVFDEAFEQIPAFDLQHNRVMSDLVSTQTPVARMAGPLA